MDSGFGKNDEQADLPPRKQSRYEDAYDSVLDYLPFNDGELIENFGKFLSGPSFDRILGSSQYSISHPQTELRAKSRSSIHLRRKNRSERATSSDSSDSDASSDDLDAFHTMLSPFFKHQFDSRLATNLGLFGAGLTPPSRPRVSRYRPKGSESKSGPVCLMGDRVVIQARGPEIDRVRYYPSGMTNPTGTLCYMNSVLQAMGVLPLFAVGVALHAPDLENSLLNAFRELYGLVWYPSECEIPEVDSCSSLNNSAAVRSFLRNNSKLFPENLEHDVEELFLYFVDGLEREVASLGLGAGPSNLVTRIFSGWTQLPGSGGKEHFYSLRLAVQDNRVHSVKDAFFAHLTSNASLDTEQKGGKPSETKPGSTASVKSCESKFSVPIERLSPTSSDDKFTYSSNDGKPKLDSTTEVDQSSSVPESNEESSDSVSPPPKALMIIQPPEVLCLCLDRNYIDHKNDTVVYDPRPLTIDEEIIIDTAHLPEGTEKPMTYQLRSVISYRYHAWGSGHYVAWTLLRTGEWALCDDSSVTTTATPSMANLASFMHFYVRVA